MVPRFIRIVLVITVALLFPATSPADNREAAPVGPDQPGAGAGAAAQQVARGVLVRFDKDDPGWKARMECLSKLVKAGPGVTPILTDALQHAAPLAREFAAQALVLFADVN